jgi:protein O-GlcNAc transferase
MSRRLLEQATQLHQAGRNGDAIALCRKILLAEPKNADARHLLGMALFREGKFDQSIEEVQRAVELAPGRSLFRRNLGAVLAGAGRYADAVAAIQSALLLGSNFPEAWNNLAIALEAIGRLDEAIDAADRAIRLRPEFADAHSNRGNSLLKSGRYDEAVAAYHKALQLQPLLPKTYHNLSYALRALGRGADAIAAARHAIELQPNYAEAYDALGGQLQAEKLFDESFVAYRKALQLRPDFAAAAYNLGNALIEAGKIDESISAFRHAAAINPRLSMVHHNLARALLQVGELDAALASHDRAIALCPEDANLHGAKLFTLHFHPRIDALMILREARNWNDRHARHLASGILPHGNNRNPDRRLRIGYVSPDFSEHVVGRNVLPILRRHDRAHHEIFYYANVKQQDEITAQFRATADVWRNIRGIDDAKVAEMIRADGIDILVDLAMHMADGRLMVFARKPAPVQVTWAAYPGTTGLAAMDYRLTEIHLDPPEQHDENYSERSIRLPDSFWCYDPLGDQAAVNELPANNAGHITFGCFNNFCKVNDVVLEHWRNVLDAVPGSRLVLLAPPGNQRNRVLESLGDRVDFIQYLPRQEYLRSYHRVDLGLDTYPYNGHTTSLDSLWMGVPVVSLCGQRVVSRAGLSQSTNLGLQDDFVARTPEQFTELAVKWAGDFPRLGELRRTLRSRMEKSPLMDALRFARNIESAYRQMWRTWCGTERRTQ